MSTAESIYTSYVIFSLQGIIYGIDASCVKEIFSLPELAIAIDAPDDIVGLLNLRGSLLPVMDLNRRFGYPFQDYRLDDSVIAIEQMGEILGIVVNQVIEVVAIASESVEATIYARHPSRLIQGVAKLNSENIALLKSDALFDYADALKDRVEESLAWTEHELESNPNHGLRRHGNFFEIFCPNSTEQERQIFRTRAERMMETSHRHDLMGLRPLAVVGLGDEYFGLDLDMVREFTEFHKVTPIPCCPDHVIGNINLRGEIVTLIDIRRALHLQVDHQSQTTKAVVVHIDDLVMGIPVEKVFDVLYLQKSDVKPSPTATSDGDRDYLQGTVLYQEKMMGILNLAKIFAEGNLSVNEEV